MRSILRSLPAAFRRRAVALCELREPHPLVQDILKEMKADGSLAAISEKWFGSDITVIAD